MKELAVWIFGALGACLLLSGCQMDVGLWPVARAEAIVPTDGMADEAFEPSRAALMGIEHARIRVPGD